MCGLSAGQKKCDQCYTFGRKEMSKLLRITTNRQGFESYRVARSCCSQRARVRNLVKWLEHESDHKTLYNVEITCGAIILSLYMTVWSI